MGLSSLPWVSKTSKQFCNQELFSCNRELHPSMISTSLWTSFRTLFWIMNHEEIEHCCNTTLPFTDGIQDRPLVQFNLKIVFTKWNSRSFRWYRRHVSRTTGILGIVEGLYTSWKRRIDATLCRHTADLPLIRTIQRNSAVTRNNRYTSNFRSRWQIQFHFNLKSKT